jgi:hypothetical protein
VTYIIGNLAYSYQEGKMVWPFWKTVCSSEGTGQAGHQWLMPVILELLRRKRSRGSQFEAILGKQFTRPYLKKTH